MAESEASTRQRLKQRVEQTLTEAFEGMLVLLDHVMQGGQRIGGIVIWDEFEGVPQLERQQVLWKTLRKRFAPDELNQIGLIMTITQREQVGAEIAV